MRGRSSNAKSRLRSAGYKCNLCGRRVTDAVSLERHHKAEHSLATRSAKVTFKAKPLLQKSKEKEKTVDNLKVDSLLESKTKPQIAEIKRSLRGSKTIDTTETEKQLSESDADGDGEGNNKTAPAEDAKDNETTEGNETSGKVVFECPECSKTFKVYFTAHKHIQKVHSGAVNRKKGSNSELQPIRVEDCYKCANKIRSNQPHQCPNSQDGLSLFAKEFMCISCNQTFISMKSYDQHVAGLHNEGVDSMFFPTKIEFTNWRLEMERQTNGKYSLLGEYDSKKIYRCQFSREEMVDHKCIAYYCPSSMIVQDFSKGIQVHFYSKHYGHAYKAYTLSSKYKTYSITSFLKNPVEDSYLKKADLTLKQDVKDLYGKFKTLMDGIVLSAANADVAVLKKVIEKALEMSSLLTDAGMVSGNVAQTKPVTNISDKDITNELELNAAVKRRKSVDSYEAPPKPAKRTRNKSLYIQDSRTSPKIVNTYSLAPNNNEIKSESVKTNLSETKTNIESDVSLNKSVKANSRVTFNDSLSSFNDSYKDFIDKNFVGIADKIKNPKPRSTVKTRLGEFKPTSPRKSVSKEASNDSSTSNKSVDESKLTTPGVLNNEVPDDNTSNLNSSKVSNANVNILSVEIPRVAVTKITSDKTANTVPKSETPKMIPRVDFKPSLSHLVDPTLVNITTASKPAASPTSEPTKVISKVNPSSYPTLTIDPLEIKHNIVVKNMNTPTVVGSSNASTPKVIKEIPRFKPNILKGRSTRVYPGEKEKIETKTPPKVTFEDNLTTESNKVKSKEIRRKPSTKKVKDFVYEVREREDECNILVLKF